MINPASLKQHDVAVNNPQDQLGPTPQHQSVSVLLGGITAMTHIRSVVTQASDHGSSMYAPANAAYLLQVTHLTLPQQPSGSSFSNIHFPNQQSTKLLDEFTDLSIDATPFYLSIIKSDGSIVSPTNLSRIRERLVNKEGQVLWTMNDTGDLVLGMKKTGGSVALKHSILANSNNELAILLERSWSDVPLELLMTWMPANAGIEKNKSREVVSAGLIRAVMIENNAFKLILDNESGHFEPANTSLDQLKPFYEPLKRCLTAGSCQFVEVALSYYTPGEPA